jgi:hypothetical protein
MSTTPPTFPISKASFISNTYAFDPLYASETIAQSANIAGALGVLTRGTVLFGPAAGTPITTATLLTTVSTGLTARCVLAADIDTTAGQVTGLVYTAGNFLDVAMTFSSLGAASDAAQLWIFDIHVMTVQQRSGLLVPMMKLPTTGGPLPQAASPHDAKKWQQEEVLAIKNAMEAYRPGMAGVPVAGLGASTEPAWAVAAFGEREPTKEEQAREKAGEQTYELGDKQAKELKDLADKQAKEMADLLKKQQEQRQQLAKTASAAIQAAEPKAPSNKTPMVPGTH